MVGWFLGTGSWRHSIMTHQMSTIKPTKIPSAENDFSGNARCLVLLLGTMVFWTLPSSMWKGWCIGCYRTFYRRPCSFPFRYSFFYRFHTVPFNHGSSRSSSQPETPGPPGGLNSRGCLPIVIQLLQYRDCERLHVWMYPKIGGYHPICDFFHGEKHDKPLSLGFPWIIRQN